MNLMTGNFTNKRIGNTQMTNYAGNPVYGYGSLGNNESGFGEVGAIWIISIRSKERERSYFSYRFSHSPNNSEANTDYEDTLNVPYLCKPIFKMMPAHKSIRLNWTIPIR